MKLCIVSDSHMASFVLQEIKNRHPECDLFIHCGDSMMPPTDEQMQGYLAVMGNNDFMYDYKSEQLINVDDKCIWVTHGDNDRVKYERHLDTLFYRAKERQADIVMFGHTHVERAEMIEGTLFLNPGSCRYTGINGVPTYMTLSTNPLTVTLINAKTHEKIWVKNY